MKKELLLKAEAILNGSDAFPRTFKEASEIWDYINSFLQEGYKRELWENM